MRYALGFILLLTSFLQSFQSLPWRAAHSEAFAFFAVLAWGWVAVRHHTGQVRLNAPIISILCLALLIVLQWVGGQIAFFGDAVVLLMYACLCIGVLVVAQLQSDEISWPSMLAATLLLAAVASALIALAQALGVWTDSGWIFPSPTYRRPGANLAQANNLSTLLVMGAGSLIYLGRRFSISRSVKILLSLLLILGMAITESRTGLLSGLVLCLWLYCRGEVLRPAPYRPVAVAGALTLIGLMWLWPSLISQIQEAGTPSPQRAVIDTAASLRIVVWPQLWEAACMKPWLGWGLRGVSAAHNAVLDTYRISEPYTYAHNIALELAIGIGLPLAGLSLCVVGVWGWRRVRDTKTTESWYAVGLLIPFAIHSSLEYPFAYSYFLVPAMLAIAVLEQNYVPPVGLAIPRKAILGSVMIFSLLVVWLTVEYLHVEEDFRVARFETVNLGKTPDGYERPSIVLLTQLGAMLVATREIPRPNMSKDELTLVGSVALRFPWLSSLNRYALALALNGSPHEALRQLQVMRAMFGEKKYQDIRENWAKIAKEKYPQLSDLKIP